MPTQPPTKAAEPSKHAAKPVRNSTTHPLEIAELRLPGGGTLGLTFCPGKQQPNAKTGAWARDLAIDIDDIAAWDAVAIITLMEQHELEALGVTELGETAATRFLGWLHLPIVDGGVPDAAFEERWDLARWYLASRLDAGAKVIIHCKGGLGRTGLLAARILIDRSPIPKTYYESDPLDQLATDAIAAVRAVRPGAIETAAQEQWLRDYANRSGLERLAEGMTYTDFYQRTYGCLLGGACGDALGAPIEFFTDERDLTRFGARGVREFEAGSAPAGAITDDTQMTLFTAEGLLRGWIRGCLKGTLHWPSGPHHGILRWYYTQAHTWRLPHAPDGYLMGIQALHQRRAPGNTCLTALGQTKELGAFADNDSKGCGGVMRVAPVGIYVGGESAFGIGADCARHTHGHPSGYLSAGWLACCVAGLLRDETLAEAASRADRALSQRAEVIEGGAKALETPRALANARVEAERTIASGVWPARIPTSLGQGWVGEEALAIAFYCALLAEAWHRRGATAVEAFEDAVSLAVTHIGDSDSTGSITGQLLGARFGAKAIPKRWAEAVELRDVIEKMASWLVGTATGRLPPASMFKLHPGW